MSADRDRNPSRQLEVVTGVIDGTRFRAAGGGFTVLVASIDGADGETSLVGELAGGVENGAKVTAHGSWRDDPKFGKQFRFEVLEIMVPSGAEQMVARLKTYPGVGPSTAEKIVEQFGARTWEMMDHSLDDLLHIPGVGPRALAKIRAHHGRQSGPVAKLRNKLISVSAPPSLAKAIHEEFGEHSMQLLDDHPYRVATKIDRFGFAMAERCARATGVDPENDERVEAGLIQTMRTQRKQGNCGMPLPALESEAAELLGVRRQALDAALERLESRGLLRYRAEMMQLSGMDRVEDRVAKALIAIAMPIRMVWSVSCPEHLSPGQRDAVYAVARAGVTVLTGGPGTGKSTVVAAVLEMAEAAGCEVTLCAPTGRAAKRLTEATGRQASTIHRLLRPVPGSGSFYYDARNPLPAGLIVVDEVSMVDIELADALFSALTPDHRVLLVGDVDQLPSVGPGNLLEDLIEAATPANIVVVRLGLVFRQSHGSTIVSNAHRLLEGLDPISDDPSLGNRGQFFCIPASTPEDAQAKIVKMATVRIPHAYDLEPTEEVQVLCPVHRGPVGTEELNGKLQLWHAGRGADSFWGASGRRFCVGDRVMQIRNDYDRNIFNGDIGFVVEFDATFLVVDFDGSQKKYKRFDLSALRLAYAMTIHKSQGGEFPAVIVPVLRENRRMTRNLIYTAITRARRLCVLVGHIAAVSAAVKTVATRRWTRLSHRLQSSE